MNELWCQALTCLKGVNESCAQIAFLSSSSLGFHLIIYTWHRAQRTVGDIPEPVFLHASCLVLSRRTGASSAFYWTLVVGSTRAKPCTRQGSERGRIRAHPDTLLRKTNSKHRACKWSNYEKRAALYTWTLACGFASPLNCDDSGPFHYTFGELIGVGGGCCCFLLVSMELMVVK